MTSGNSAGGTRVLERRRRYEEERKTGGERTDLLEYTMTLGSSPSHEQGKDQNDSRYQGM